MQYILAYIATTISFFALDFFWINYFAKDYLTERIGDLIQFNITAAIIFYLIYIFGIVLFAVSPALLAGNWKVALFLGAAFGFFCYATYDMTNLATLKDWPVSFAVLDIAWGTFLTGSSAALGFIITKYFVG